MIALYRYTIVYSASYARVLLGCRGGVVLYGGGSAAAVFTSAPLPLIPYYTYVLCPLLLFEWFIGTVLIP